MMSLNDDNSLVIPRDFLVPQLFRLSLAADNGSPAWLLNAGDVLDSAIEGIGAPRDAVVDEPAA